MKYLFLFYFILLIVCSCTKGGLIKTNTSFLGDSCSQKAYVFLDNNQQDSSFVYFDLASGYYLQDGDTLSAANCLIYMAITLYDEGDYYGAQEMSLTANTMLDSLDKSHYEWLASNYNILANAISAIDDVSLSFPYYDLAIRFAHDSLTANVYKNNKAVTLYQAGRYDEAFEIYESNLNKSFSNAEEYARALSNYANLKWRIDERYDALPDLKIALQLREKNKDTWGMHSSYSHLHAYYININDSKSALYYARKAYTAAQYLNSPDDKLKAIVRMINLNSTDSVKHYFALYKSLEDSIQTTRLKARNQYVLIRHEVEKNKSENTKLHAEIAQKKASASRQRMLTGVICVFALSVMIVSLNWYRKREIRIELEVGNRIKENQLKISRKVHDVVANGIYRVMSEIEYIEGYNRELILDKLELMYEKSRDISYEVENDFQYSQNIIALLHSFANEKIKILIVGNEEKLWDKILNSHKNEILLIYQEIMVNMCKHSCASEVVVAFKIKRNKLYMSYQDNGKGCKSNMNFGNGLNNTVSRINQMAGIIIFEATEGKGLIIKMTIPIA